MQNLLLTSEAIDRDALRRDRPELLAQLRATDSTRIVRLRGDLLEITSEMALRWHTPDEFNRAVASAASEEFIYLGRDEEHSYLAHLGPDLPDPPSADGWGSLRAVAPQLSERDASAASSAVALANWHRRHPRCPQCGGATRMDQAGWIRRCEVDDSMHFPRTDPAVIMAVVDADDRILLARGRRWNGPRRSVLAGFVEPGEAFEHAVVRETWEESGVRVWDVRYRGSQPWPFPASVMVGFVARTGSDVALTAQPGEIEALAWYSRADVRSGIADGTLQLPGRISIARALIEEWYGEPLPQ